MKEGDFVVYYVSGKPEIGKFVRTQYNGRCVILPQRKQNSVSVVRNKKQIVSLNDMFKKYEPLLKGQ